MQTPDTIQSVDVPDQPPPTPSPGEATDTPIEDPISDERVSEPPADEPPPPAASARTVDDDTVTKVRCAHCGTKAEWPGPLTDDMLARTFTRGIDPQSGLPNCPRCGHAFQLIAFVPVEEAIARASRELGTGAHQPRIPGLLPQFDFESAFKSIIAQREVVRRAQATAEEKHRVYAKAKKTADEEQTALSTLEDDFADRSRDAAYERTKPVLSGGPCSWELAHPGQRCPVCRLPANEMHDTGHDAALAQAIDLAASGIYPTGTDLRDLVAVFADVHVTPAEAAAIPIVDVAAVLTWLKQPTADTRPSALGVAHIVGDPPDTCVNCGALLRTAAASFGIETLTPKMQLGTDCDNRLADEMPPATLRELLAKAGADVTVADVEGWTTEQQLEARTWATEQLEATRLAKPGHAPSVRWPDHVSRAHHGDAARTPRKRHATRQDASRARQRAAKDERRPAAAASTSGVQKVEKSRSRTPNTVAPKPRVSGMGKKHGMPRGRRG
jgi:hypothetical protein